MELILEKKHENRIEFSAKDVTTSIANMVRRYSVSRVPVLAMDSVTVYDNTGSFWDEYVAHRLGLMPVTTPRKTPKSAEIIFSLDAEGPKKVYSEELKSSDKGIKIALDSIPVVTLGQNQRIRLEGKAVLRNAVKHAKFQAGIVSYGVKEDGKFKFMVESFYQMPPRDVIERGCDEIVKDIEELEKALKKKK